MTRNPSTKCRVRYEWEEKSNFELAMERFVRQCESVNSIRSHYSKYAYQ